MTRAREQVISLKDTPYYHCMVCYVRQYFMGWGACAVVATTGGVVSLGYPYGDDLSYQYVRITTSDGYVVRQLYVSPASGIDGTAVAAGQVIGTAQALGPRCSGITNHVHVDIRHNDQLVDPTTLTV